MATLHFVGANGFPAKCYEHILDQWRDHDVYYINVVAQHLGSKKLTWNGIADEIISHIESNNCAPVVGIGHSMGASSTLLAAHKRPDLFSQLILVEPILFRPVLRTLIYMRKFRDLENGGNPFAKQARERKHLFASKQQAFDYFSEKPLFKNFSPESLANYIEHGIKANPHHSHDSDAQFTLSFPRDTEADIFARAPLLVKKPKLDMPVKLLLGASSDLVAYMHISLWRKYLAAEDIIYRPGGHLFPFEEPDNFVTLVENIISDNQEKLQPYEKKSQMLMPSPSASSQQNTMHISQSIKASSEDIFPYFLDEVKRPLWINGLRDFNYIEKKAEVIGSTFKQRVVTPGQGEMSYGVVKDYQENKSIKLQIKSSVLTIDQHIILESKDNSTNIIQDLSFELTGRMKLISPLISSTVNLTLRRQVIENLMNLKKILETQNN